MENKVVYLLRHLGSPQKYHKKSRGYFKTIKDAEAHFGISIYERSFGQKERSNYSGENRFFFKFPRYARDDSKAIRIGESILLGIELSYGPFGDIYSPDPIYNFPSSLFSKKGFVTEKELQDFEESKLYGHRAYDFFGELISACWISPYHIEAAWKIARALFCDQNLFNGANFLKSSQEKYYVWPGQSREIIGDTSTAQAGWEQSRLEDALINAYKTIETVIGDIPKDDRKYFNKLVQKEINPHELVGYSFKREIQSVIREINSERDKKSAHGKTPNRKIIIGDMFEYQACARHILIRAIEHQLGEKVF